MIIIYKLKENFKKKEKITNLKAKNKIKTRFWKIYETYVFFKKVEDKYPQSFNYLTGVIEKNKILENIIT